MQYLVLSGNVLGHGTPPDGGGGLRAIVHRRGVLGKFGENFLPEVWSDERYRKQLDWKSITRDMIFSLH